MKPRVATKVDMHQNVEMERKASGKNKKARNMPERWKVSAEKTARTLIWRGRLPKLKKSAQVAPRNGEQSINFKDDRKRLNGAQ